MIVYVIIISMYAMNKDLPRGRNKINIKTGDKLSGGVYFIRVKAGENEYNNKLINLR